MVRKTTKKRSSKKRSARKTAEEAGRNVRGGKGIIGARRSRDARLKGIMGDIASTRGKKRK